MLEFEQESKNRTSSNLHSLYGIQRIPSDTQTREILDEVDPNHLSACFQGLFRVIQRGRCLDAFEWKRDAQDEPYYLLSIDGTGYFSSHEVYCDSCLKKENHHTHEIRYEHQMLSAAIVSPHLKTVIPLCPEPIIQQDGSTKQDCELSAFKRIIRKIRRDHPKLNLVVTLDALYAAGSVIELLQELQIHFIVGVKPESHETLFRCIAGRLQEKIWQEEVGEKIKKTRTHRYLYSENVPLNNQKIWRGLNFLEYFEITEHTGKDGKTRREQKHFSWITDLSVSTRPQRMQLMQGGRARWKIENETFNTLKNQGYHFEHNFGHGKKHLCTNFALLMMLAFLVDQIQEMSCKIFKKLLSLVHSKTRLWQGLKYYYRIFYFKGYTDFLNALIRIEKDGPITWNTS